ncbi:glycoside hydrolase family 16 protein [Chitinophaga arvensicola]|uniref:Glycosyl hydrolases family 16 n=1 Tax=Chitinophaga arvensicola TaxID=29529 RepID=A0A1I0S828_9BACT|nr:glycoside hydrolase family 16 protein [Chitinophaga arvensicola]SEW52034.1 Glycosyl hydrolases family 16 [Chitinophaga arvensicola]
MLCQLKRPYLLLILLPLFTQCKKNSSPATNPPEEEKGPTAYAGYDLVWNDEFSGTTLNRQKWNIETGTGNSGNWGTGQLDRATDRIENLDVKDGNLAVTTRKEFLTDRNYTSGRINTKDLASFGPGSRIEARVFARDVKYKGQGFAFWMMPAEKPADQPYIMWPQGGEIDIMEYVGSIPYHNLGTVHYAWSYQNNEYKDWNHGMKGAYYSYTTNEVPAVKPQYGTTPPVDNDPAAGSGGYHIYRIDWFTDRIEFSIDEHIYHINYFNDGAAFSRPADGQDGDTVKIVNGKRVMSSEYSHHFNEWKPFDHKFYIILSAGVGGNDNQTYGGKIVDDAKFPCTVLVDWVRAYKRK